VPDRTGGRRSRRFSRVAAVVSVLGELLITAGLVMALFVVYSLWWTNVIANRQAGEQSDKVRERWAATEDRTAPGASGPGERNLKNGIGFLHVPAMSDDDILVTEGTGTDHLNKGVAGYYTDPVEATLPWDGAGNFSLAAHRDGHGARFHDIHDIEDGDAVVFETEYTWYVYEVYAILPETSKYNVDVLRSVPEVSGRAEEGRYITLTTCTPMYTSEHRYIVWGELDRTVPVDEDRTPPEELR
jgi:LPXTG-site transpeptidase (sortase) family protein